MERSEQKGMMVSEALYVDSLEEQWRRAQERESVSYRLWTARCRCLGRKAVITETDEQCHVHEKVGSENSPRPGTRVA